jgi:hypothetical protein
VKFGAHEFVEQSRQIVKIDGEYSNKLFPNNLNSGNLVMKIAALTNASTGHFTCGSRRQSAR